MNFQRNGNAHASYAPMATTDNFRMHTVGSSVDRNDNGAGAKKNTACGSSLAMVYAPYQKWQNILDADTALCKGTIFAGLVKPFCPGL